MTCPKNPREARTTNYGNFGTSGDFGNLPRQLGKLINEDSSGEITQLPTYQATNF
jgi:hypothetical protein